jgi:hypothetical protein
VTPWRNWFHVTGSMYGQWLPGDDRGWRERNHRRHVDADYRHPFPKGAFQDLRQRSEALMKHDPVELTHDQRMNVCTAFYDALVERGVEVVELSIGAKHWHALTRFVPIDQVPTKQRDPKLLIGAAKGKCSYVLSQKGMVKPGGIWAHGCRTLPIEDEEHFWNTRKYVHDHVRQGAAVLTELMKLPEPRP